jgi:hypothetical protein
MAQLVTIVSKKRVRAMKVKACNRRIFKVTPESVQCYYSALSEISVPEFSGELKEHQDRSE